MTRDEHRQRHVELHRSLDELFADFIRHAPRDQHQFLDMPLSTLLSWSYQQTLEPTELEEAK